MIPIVIINFIFYYLSSIFNNVRVKIGFSLLFILSTIVLRLMVNNSQLPDYDGYHSVTGMIDPEFSFKIFFTSRLEASSPESVAIPSEKKYFNGKIPKSVCTYLLLATLEIVEISI